MQKAIYTIMLSSLPFALAACGGSSSNDMDSYNQPQLSAKELLWNKWSDEEKISSVGLGGDNYFVRLNTNDPVAIYRYELSFPSENNIYEVEIEGMDISLKNNNGITVANPDQIDYKPSWKMFNGPNFLSNGVPNPRVYGLLSYIGSDNFTVGVINLGVENSHEYAFVKGSPTPEAEIPTQGMAKYLTTFAYRLSEPDSSIQGLDSKEIVNVDFEHKKVMAEFTVGKEGNIPVILNADIKGNTFSSSEHDSMKVKGNFFGRSAEEIGGIFQNENMIGAFAGAKGN